MVRIVLLVFAVLSAAVAALLAMSLQSAKSPIVEKPPKKILFATVDIAAGADLNETMFAWLPWPEQYSNERFVDHANGADAILRLTKLTARVKIYRGEPIIEEKFTSKGTGPLALQLSSGKRAVAVRVNAENTAGGFIRPGDKVDVLHTSAQAGDNRVLTQVLLEAITVLAIDQATDVEGEKPRNTFVGRTATLELSPQQAEVIVAAETQGRLSLALRSAREDQSNLQTSDAPFRTMRTIRGTQSDIERLSQQPLP